MKGGERQQAESGMALPGGPAWNVLWSYAVLRFTLGTSFLFHSVARFVSGWSNFADQMVQSFHNTFLPDFMVRPFALSVPPVEAVLGALLCLGLFTRWTLIAGGLWMTALVFRDDHSAGTTPRSPSNSYMLSSFSCCKRGSHPTEFRLTP
jgi:uncharacterized membrane protein YphA (DoxX/SURF4 family)